MSSQKINLQQHKQALRQIISDLINAPDTTSTQLYDDLNDALDKAIEDTTNATVKAKAMKDLILGHRPLKLDHNVTQEQVTQSKDFPPRY